MSNDQPTWQSVDDIARILNLAKSSVYGGRLRQSLGFIRCGKQLRLPPGALESWAAKQLTTPPRCRRKKG